MAMERAFGSFFVLMSLLLVRLLGSSKVSYIPFIPLFHIRNRTLSESWCFSLRERSWDAVSVLTPYELDDQRLIATRDKIRLCVHRGFAEPLSLLSSRYGGPFSQWQRGQWRQGDRLVPSDA